jgi:hypothetical protein
VGAALRHAVGAPTARMPRGQAAVRALPPARVPPLLLPLLMMVVFGPTTSEYGPPTQPCQPLSMALPVKHANHAHIQMCALMPIPVTSFSFLFFSSSSSVLSSPPLPFLGEGERVRGRAGFCSVPLSSLVFCLFTSSGAKAFGPPFKGMKRGGGRTMGEEVGRAAGGRMK